MFYPLVELVLPVLYYYTMESEMNESQYIQKVRQMIGDFKAADRQRNEEEAKARHTYETECQKANAEFRNVQKEIQQKRERKRFVITGIIIVTVILISAIGYSIYTTNRTSKLKTHYAAAVEAFKMKNLGKAREEFKKVFAIKKNYKNALNLLKETYSQEFQNFSNEDRPTITILETMEFIWIPSGCFIMGGSSNEKGRKDEELLHIVCVDGFWIGKTEVTNGQYRKWKKEHNSGNSKGRSLNDDNQPVVNVNWEDAKAFAVWLTIHNRDRYKFRLPTEAEWEYAARAGTTTSRFWGDDTDNACKYANVGDENQKEYAREQILHLGLHNCDDGYIFSAPVGSFRPNGFGLYDMLGNVWEWCEDIYSIDAYKKHSLVNPIYNGPGTTYVLRGGSWGFPPQYVRSASRIGLESKQFTDVGFRLIMIK